MKLVIELVPSTSWFSNVRSQVSQKNWDILKKESYKKSEYKCDICNGKGNRHPVECHEIWDYNDENKIQTLIGLTSLCPSCHQVKHIGLSFQRGIGKKVIKHFMKINEISYSKAIKLIDKAFLEHHKRSQYEWTLDLSYLDNKGIPYTK